MVRVADRDTYDTGRKFAMTTTLETYLEEALTCIDPEFDVTEEPDVPDDFAADEARGDTWPRGAIGNGQSVLYAAEGDYFDQQDARYESARRIALALVR